MKLIKNFLENLKSVLKVIVIISIIVFVVYLIPIIIIKKYSMALGLISIPLLMTLVVTTIQYIDKYIDNKNEMFKER